MALSFFHYYFFQISCAAICYYFVPVTECPDCFFIRQDGNGQFQFAVANLDRVRRFQVVIRRRKDFQFSNVIIGLHFGVTFKQRRLGPIYNDGRGIKVFGDGIAGRPFGVVPSISARGRRLAGSLCVGKQCSIFRGDLLNNVSNVSARQRFALPKVVHSRECKQRRRTASAQATGYRFNYLRNGVVKRGTVNRVQRVWVVKFHDSPQRGGGVVFRLFRLAGTKC